MVWGVDPGFAKFGLCVADIGHFVNDPAESPASWLQPRAFHLISTEKSDKKQNTSSTDDNFRRAQELAAFLEKIPRPQLICAESMSFSPGASAAAKLAMAWGVFAGFAQRYQLPVLQVGPAEIKRALNVKAAPRPPKGEKRKRSDTDKVAVAQALNGIYGAPKLFHLLTGLPNDLLEHPLDGLAAIIACANTSGVRLLRKLGT